MARGKKQALTYREGKGYTRDIGYRRNSSGKRVQPRFLLGRDRLAAESANLKLEALWMLVCEDAERRVRVTYNGPSRDVEPVWSEVSLAIAHALRRGETAYRVALPEAVDGQDEADCRAYATHVHAMSEKYGKVIAIVPDDPALMLLGQEGHAQVAELRARQARINSAIAGTPVPQTGTDQMLYQAIQAYAEYAREHRKGGENEPKDALAIRDAIADMPLKQFGYDALEAMGAYWRGRPESRRHGANGKPIAVSTVTNRLKSTRRFVRWLSRSGAWDWQPPAEWEQALKMDERRIQTEDELLATANGPATWTDDEIATLFKHASDYERCLLLLGLNLGFAQSEVMSFRLDDLRSDEGQPIIRRVRRKTRRLFSASLWPETVDAIEWLQRHRDLAEEDDKGWIVVNAKGKRPSSSQIANLWNRLLDRVQSHAPGFRRMPFKSLRKTAYQLVLEASGSMEIAGTCEGRGQVSVDQQADRYGRRLFNLVFQALDKVRDRLGGAVVGPPRTDAVNPAAGRNAA